MDKLLENILLVCLVFEFSVKKVALKYSKKVVAELEAFISELQRN